MTNRKTALSILAPDWFSGGRECRGLLKGFDPLLNIVLDDTIEYLRDPDDVYKLTQDTRHVD